MGRGYRCHSTPTVQIIPAFVHPPPPAATECANAPLPTGAVVADPAFVQPSSVADAWCTNALIAPGPARPGRPHQPLRAFGRPRPLGRRPSPERGRRPVRARSDLAFAHLWHAGVILVHEREPGGTLAADAIRGPPAFVRRVRGGGSPAHERDLSPRSE